MTSPCTPVADCARDLPSLLRLSAGKGNVVYVTGRSRAKGEINGKSANLNNALKNIIYKDYVSRPSEIAAHEVIVVFDADMQAKRNFFCKVCTLSHHHHVPQPARRVLCKGAHTSK